MRPHVAAVYAFARTADDFADEGDAPIDRGARCSTSGSTTCMPRARRRRPLDDDRARAAMRQRASDLRRARPHRCARSTLPVRSSRSCSRVPPGRDGDALRRRGRTWTTTAGGRPTRSAGSCCASSAIATTALDAASDAICTALQLTNFWQDFAVDWRAGRLYVPERRCAARRRRARRLDRAAVITPEWQRALAACAGAHARRCSTAASRVSTTCAAASAGSCARRGTAVCASSIGSSRVGFDSSRAPRCAAARRRRCAGGRVEDAAVSRDTSFYYSFLVLPRPQRDAIVTVWDVCRAIDDAVDEAASAADRRARRRRLLARRDRPVLRRRHAGVAAGRGAAAGRRATSRCRGAPSRIWSTASQMDLERDALRHLRRPARVPAGAWPRRSGSSASTSSAAAIPAARDYAMQPRAGAAAHQHPPRRRRRPRARPHLPAAGRDGALGCSEARPARPGASPPEVAALLAFSAARARDYYDRAAAALPPGEARHLVAAEIMGAIYFAILQRIERRGYDVFSEVRAGAAPAAGAASPPTRAMRASRRWPAALVTAADVVVVGAGCAGLSAAVRLAEAGRARAGGRGRPVAGRPRLRDRRSGRRGEGRQRPARAARLLSRDLAFLRAIGAERPAVDLDERLDVAMVDRPRPSAAGCPPALPAAVAPGRRRARWSAFVARPAGRAALGLALRRFARRATRPRGAAWRPDRARVAGAHGQAPRLCELLWEPLASPR